MVFIGKMNWDGGSLLIIFYLELLFIMIYLYIGNIGLYFCYFLVFA